MHVGRKQLGASLGTHIEASRQSQGLELSDPLGSRSLGLCIAHTPGLKLVVDEVPIVITGARRSPSFDATRAFGLF